MFSDSSNRQSSSLFVKEAGGQGCYYVLSKIIFSDAVLPWFLFNVCLGGEAWIKRKHAFGGGNCFAIKIIQSLYDHKTIIISNNLTHAASSAWLESRLNDHRRWYYSFHSFILSLFWQAGKKQS